jgi:hypothetical protein
MPYVRHGKEYTQGPSVIYSHRGKETPTSATLDLDNFPKNSEGVAQIPAGSFIVEMFNSDGDIINRCLPSAKLANAVTTSDTELTIARQIEKYPYVPFLVGDILKITHGFAKFTVSATTAGSVTIFGQTLTFTPTGATDVNEAATMFAEHFSKRLVGLYHKIKVLAYEDDLYFVAEDKSQTFTITPDGTNIINPGGTPGDPLTTAVENTAIGTVSQVDLENNKVTLAAASTLAIPEGMAIGAEYLSIKGLLETGIELRSEFPSENHGLVTGGSVYKLRIPYWEESINQILPKLTVRERF